MLEQTMLEQTTLEQTTLEQTYLCPWNERNNFCSELIC
jgi:hypothetical protein